MTEAHLSIPALPYEYTFPTQHVALVVIDMQRDFVLSGGFGFLQAAAAGADLTELSAKMTRVVRRCQELVEAARRAGLYVIHTREGHRRDLSDCPFSKIERQASAPGTLHTVHIGDQGTAFDGPMLVQGSYSHDFVDELQPRAGEAVFDKPGKGAFFATGLDAYLANRQITHLILVGVTTECCVTTTLREANDRGYQCCLVADCTDGYNDGFGRACLAMTTLSDGLFGWVSDEGREIVRQLATVHRDASPPVGSASPAQVLSRIKQVNGSHNRIFTRLASLQELETRSEAVKLQNQGSWPLAGRLFAVKDMISTPGLPSRMCNFGKEEASLDEGASSIVSSPVVDRLQEAGAVLVGKTNMDVLATGLTGTRSDVGNPLCKPDPTRIPGGSSSGSAVAVAEGLCDFSIGTDTAGSGRIPAAFNGVVGFKPSKASLSTDGVLPCMPSLDCVTIFASTAALVQRVWLVAKGDASSGAPSPTHRKAGRAVGRLEPAFQRRFTFAVPDDETIKRLCEPCFATSFAAATERLASAFGATKAMLSRDEFQGFYDAGQAVYFSGLAAERLFHVKRHVEDLNKLHGATRKHLEAAAKVTVDEVLEAQAKVQTMRQWGDGFWDAHRDYDVLVFPTAPCHPTVTVMQASVDDNLSIGSSLAAFTACANVLDMPAVSIPSPFVGEEAHRPFSIMLMAPRHDDGFLLRLAQLYQEREHPESE